MKEKKAQKGVDRDFEEVVKRMLVTPPQPHKPAEKKKAKKR